jgi:cytochrome c5
MQSRWREMEKMRYVMGAVVLALSIAAIPLLAQGNDGKQQDRPQTPSNAVNSGGPNRGQQVFEENCSRCHNPPEGFSPRISKAVAMHMRVRANLSDADYKELLRFLNP